MMRLGARCVKPCYQVFPRSSPAVCLSACGATSCWFTVCRMSRYPWCRMHDWFVRNVPERVAFAVVGVMALAAVVAIAALRWMMLD